jgi:hypothetical protein
VSKESEELTPLQKAQVALEQKRKDGGGIQVRGGKKYMEIVDRIDAFRKFFQIDMGITTELLHADDNCVRMKATIHLSSGDIVATGHAEEIRSGKGVNATSALENCETSAVGRALAMLGLHGGSIASADEVISAINMQDTIEKLDEYLAEILKRFPKAENPVTAWEAITEKLEGQTHIIRSNPVLSGKWKELLNLKKELIK